jgi:hypothetical protein
MWAMRFLTTTLCALIVSATVIVPAQAGWDNVFQPTLFERWRQQTTTNYYVPPVVVQSSPIVVAQSSPVVVAQASPCDPCQKCTTNYVQRSYYQPVQVMETRTVQEAVTTYRTSYYYEPITTYRYSYYYDPCKCGYQQVATPTTAYQLREQQTPVQSWVSRCVQVPVTAYQKVDTWQPQTTCCNTTQGAPIYNTQPPPGAPPVNTVPLIQPIPERPRIETKTESYLKPDMYQQYYPQPERNSTMPGTSYTPQLGTPIPLKPAAPPAPVKMDRIAVGPNSVVEGQVLRADNSPKPSAKVLFVNASSGQRQTTFANNAGRFRTELAAGSWHVYVHGANDLPIYQTRIDVSGGQFRQVSLNNKGN